MNHYENIEETKESYRRELPEPDPSWYMSVQRALTCIHNNLFAQILTVAWMKENCRINGHNFSSRFAYYVGRTPKEYINHQRVNAGKQILSNAVLANISVSVIAYELGFGTVSAFSKCFKRHTGLAPSRWRKENGNG